MIHLLDAQLHTAVLDTFETKIGQVAAAAGSKTVMESGLMRGISDSHQG